MLLIPVQLSEGRLAHLRLPPDLTENEGRKLAAVVMAYVDYEGVFRQPQPTWEAYLAALEGGKANTAPKETA